MSSKTSSRLIPCINLPKPIDAYFLSLSILPHNSSANDKIISSALGKFSKLGERFGGLPNTTAP